MGGRPLAGEVFVSGSKNAALPIIFSCILLKGVSEIENLPDIGDTRAALHILRNMGAMIYRRGDKVFIDTREVEYVRPTNAVSSQLRASTYLIGACLGRFGISHISEFGGCSFQDRPIDMHLDACRLLGCRVEGDHVSGYPRGGEIRFAKPSVGATVNAILLAATARGTSRIYGYACEPHIDCLIDFLISAGASVVRHADHLEICGRELSGGKISIIADMIEAGSYLALGLMTEGKIRVNNLPIPDMASVLDAFYSLGAEWDGDMLKISHPAYCEINARPYPLFPTDLQPIFAPLMAKYSGGSITDEVWSGRFGYLKTLAAFGVGSKTKSNTAEIFTSQFSPARVSAPDLRGGFAALMCALCASGESSVYSCEIILRGYENLCEKLRALGAKINIYSIN
jgi:UDP-N-acetylglucosamine 1-carboxyvinyltransferase